MEGQYRPRQTGMMTLPITQFIRSTQGRQPVYDGATETAMRKESSFRKWADRHAEDVARSLSGLEKVASRQVSWILESPKEYPAPDVEAAVVQKITQDAS
jgi:hypothetical protein